MHTDENKKFDIRNVERNIRSGLINKKDYETYLLKLPESSEKAFNPGEFLTDSEAQEPSAPMESPSKKKGNKKKKGK